MMRVDGREGGKGWVQSLLQPRVNCEMKADGFVHLMPGIHRSESRTQNPSNFLEQLFQLLLAKLYAVVLKYSRGLRPLNFQKPSLFSDLVIVVIHAVGDPLTLFLVSPRMPLLLSAN